MAYGGRFYGGSKDGIFSISRVSALVFRRTHKTNALHHTLHIFVVVVVVVTVVVVVGVLVAAGKKRHGAGRRVNVSTHPRAVCADTLVAWRVCGVACGAGSIRCV